MGLCSSAEAGKEAPRTKLGRDGPTPVSLHIYNFGLGGTTLNRCLQTCGAGAYHCGVEVYNIEWSFGNVRPGASSLDLGPSSGVFRSLPRKCHDCTYCESVDLGMTQLSEYGVVKIIQILEDEWPASSYQVVSHNCCHFCKEFARRLGVGLIPDWVNRLADLGVLAGHNARSLAECTSAAVPTECTTMHCCYSAPDEVESSGRLRRTWKPASMRRVLRDDDEDYLVDSGFEFCDLYLRQQQPLRQGEEQQRHQQEQESNDIHAA